MMKKVQTWKRMNKNNLRLIKLKYENNDFYVYLLL